MAIIYIRDCLNFMGDCCIWKPFRAWNPNDYKDFRVCMMLWNLSKLRDCWKVSNSLLNWFVSFFFYVFLIKYIFMRDFSINIRKVWQWDWKSSVFMKLPIMINPSNSLNSFCFYNQNTTIKSNHQTCP